MKRKLTEIPITIVTDDEHKTGDNLEMTRQRIERAAMYLMSVFNLMKVCSINFEGQSESKEMSGFFEDINNHCDIGYGIADSVMASASFLTEFQPDATTSEPESVAGDETGLDSIAAQISRLLNNPDLPKPIRRGFDKVMVDFINRQLDHDEFNDDMNSAEYIARHLRVYKNENES